MLYRLIKISVPCFMFIALLSCKSTFQVQTETFKDINFSSLNSFKFYNPQNIPKSNFSFNERNKKIIFDAIAKELKLRGFTSKQNSDVVVRVQGGTKVIRESTERYPPSTYYSGNYYNYPTYSDYYDDISKKNTTIIIDVLNTKDNKLLWQGVVSGEMGKKPDEVEAKLKAAIQQVFDEYPVASAYE